MSKKPSKASSPSTYDLQAHQESCDRISTPYVQVPCWMTETLGIEVAYFAAAVVDWCSHKGKPAENDGWFYYPVKTMLKNMKLSRRTQQRLMGRLRELRIVETRLAGEGKQRRWLRVDFVRLEEIKDQGLHS